MNGQTSSTTNASSIEQAKEVYCTFQKHLEKRLWGRMDDIDRDSPAPGTIQLLLNAFFSGGHILFEDFPGSGKSFMATTMAEMIFDDIKESEIADQVEIVSHKRIQCTPDLMPQDLTGYYDQHHNFVPGPIFAYFLLVDEINRTTPKVQSALLEAMAERSVTVDGITKKLGQLFFVIATMNPLDRVGTYELPVAQLDRFLFKRRLSPIKQMYEARIMLDEAFRSRNDPAITDLPCIPSPHPEWIEREYKEYYDKEIFNSKKFSKSDPMPVSKINLAREAMLKHVEIHPDLVPKMLQVSDSIHRKSIEQGAIFKEGSRPSVRSMQKFINAVKIRAFIEVAGSNQIPASIVACPRHYRELALDLLRHRVVPVDSRMKAAELDKELLKLVSEIIRN